MGRTSHTRQAWRRRRFLPVFSDKRTVCRGVDDSELLRSVFTQAPDKRPKPGGEPPLLPPRRPSPAQLQPSAHPRRPTLLSLHPSLHPTLLRANSTLTALQRARAMRNLNYIIYFFLFFSPRFTAMSPYPILLLGVGSLPKKLQRKITEQARGNKERG